MVDIESKKIYESWSTNVTIFFIGASSNFHQEREREIERKVLCLCLLYQGNCIKDKEKPETMFCNPRKNMGIPM